MCKDLVVEEKKKQTKEDKKKNDRSLTPEEVGQIIKGLIRDEEEKAWWSLILQG